MSVCFEVKAETKEGSVHVLRRFGSREEAESHPVRMKHWKRVWVEEASSAAADESFPPFPWNCEWARGHAYMVDANGKRFASLLGTQSKREKIAEFLCGLKS